MIKEIRPNEVYLLNHESGAIALIDVREADEVADLSTPLADNHPLSTFDVESIAKKYGRQTSIYLICRSGRRSRKAAELLEAAGFTSLYNVEGGMMEWQAQGIPVVRR